MNEGHKFQWTTTWGDQGRETDLTKIPCNSAFGVSSCWPCYILPMLKQALVDAIDLALNGRTQVTVSSAYYYVPFYSLDPKWVNVDWFQDVETKEVTKTS